MASNQYLRPPTWLTKWCSSALAREVYQRCCKELSLRLRCNSYLKVELLVEVKTIWTLRLISLKSLLTSPSRARDLSWRLGAEVRRTVKLRSFHLRKREWEQESQMDRSAQNLPRQQLSTLSSERMVKKASKIWLVRKAKVPKSKNLWNSGSTSFMSGTKIPIKATRLTKQSTRSTTS